MGFQDIATLLRAGKPVPGIRKKEPDYEAINRNTSNGDGRPSFKFKE
jgi:hypothetical protein